MVGKYDVLTESPEGCTLLRFIVFGQIEMLLCQWVSGLRVTAVSCVNSTQSVVAVQCSVFTGQLVRYN